MPPALVELEGEMASVAARWLDIAYNHVFAST